MKKPNNVYYRDVSDMSDSQYFKYIEHILSNLCYDESYNVSNLYLEVKGDILYKCTTNSDVQKMIKSVVSGKQQYFYQLLIQSL